MLPKESKDDFNSLFTDFSEYQRIMNRNITNYEHVNWYNKCLNFNNMFYTANIMNKDNLCIQAMRYLYNISSDIKNPLKENHFKYLYYWIYKHHIKAAKDRNYIKEFYKEIIRVYEYAGMYIYFVNSFRDLNFDNELELIIDICDISKKLNDIKYSTFTSCNKKTKCDCADECADIYVRGHKICENNWDKHFCKILKSYKNEYNALNLSNDCDNLKFKTWPSDNFENIILPSAQINKSKTAIISSFLILIIPAFLFIIYKVKYDFLPYNTCLHREIKEIINKCRGLKKEWSKSENSEIYNNICRNSNYNVIYSSHYIDD
ncbi:variable surface protein [Plasmodium gonderi]|uniref:Variable surface protein n=1 Tax=Plasmodium gonderi TaxID=77519 RepID=A0A1Y1JPM8_PLAGO|nr:variable surface protein [Plasmodium gonderi]GAW84576.1 variable surface protein [Plasmodium gonderi]